MGLFSFVKVPNQWVDMQMAAPNNSGYSQMAYIDMSPPMLLPAMQVFSRSEYTEYFLSIKGLSSLLINFK